jgi:hypothetical protein
MQVLVEFTENPSGRSVAINVQHIVSIHCTITGKAKIVTAEHTEGLDLDESYVYVRDVVRMRLKDMYPYGTQA